MRVCLTSNDPYNPLSGGGCLRVRRLAEYLSYKHEVYVVAPSRGAPNRTRVFVSPLNLLPVSRFHRWKTFEYAIFSVFLVPKLLFLCLRRKIDLVVAHNAVSGFAASVVGKIIPHTKIIQDVTDVLTLYMETYKTHSIFRLTALHLELLAFRLSDKIIAVSNPMRDWLTSQGISPEKIVVIYDGAEVDKFNGDKIASLPIIIHHGGIDPYNNAEIIVKAAPFVLKKHPNVMFYIVGHGLSLNEVILLAKKNQVEEHFLFTGWVSYEEIPKYLRRATIGVIGRSNKLANHLVFTLKLLEYWASQTVVVAPKLKAIEQVGKDGQDLLFYEPDNAVDLGNKICTLLEQEELRQRLVNNGRKKVEEFFDWNMLIRQMSEVCESFSLNA